jgi:hypothetical protein
VGHARWITRCPTGYDPNFVIDIPPTEPNRSMKPIGPPRVGTTTPLSGKPRTSRKRGGIPPSNTREPVEMNGGCDQPGTGGGNVRKTFSPTVATASLATRERASKAGVCMRRGREALAGCRRLDTFDSRPLLAVIRHCVNCNGTLTQQPRRGYLFSCGRPSSSPCSR